MNRLLKITGLIILLLVFTGKPSSAYTNVDLAFSFHDVLEPHGAWINISSYGNVWRPHGSGFVPYTNGYWANSSGYGMTWVGAESWAWAPYHYGRWVFSAQYGWVWIPGYEYHPGRVAWATGPDYIGWSPYGGYGGSGINANWTFVHRDNFGRDNYAPYRVRYDTVRGLVDRRAIQLRSGALQRTEVERIIRRPVRVVTLEERRVTADRRSARLIVPRERMERVRQQISTTSKTSSKVFVKTSSKESVKIQQKHGGSDNKVMVKTKSSSHHVSTPQRTTTYRTSKPQVEPTRKTVTVKKQTTVQASKPKFEPTRKTVTTNKTVVQQKSKSSSSKKVHPVSSILQKKHEVSMKSERSDSGKKTTVKKSQSKQRQSKSKPNKH